MDKEFSEGQDLPGQPPEPLFPKGEEVMGGTAPEAVRFRERSLYTVEGDNFIIEFQEALDSGDVERIRESVEKSCTFMEGLYFGMYGEDYDLNDPLVVGELLSTFTTAEGSTDRPSYGYLFYAIRHGLTQAVNEANKFRKVKDRGEEAVSRWRKRLLEGRKVFWQSMSESRKLQGKGELTPEEIEQNADLDVQRYEKRLNDLIKIRNELIGLKNHVDARILIFDRAFRERQETVNSEEGWKNSKKVTPDKGDWIAYYWGNRDESVWNEKGISEWGDAVSRVEKVIEDIGRGKRQIAGFPSNHREGKFARDVYTNGFESTDEFVAWLKELLKESRIGGRERMDVVWAAWRMSLWKERITALAWKVDLRRDSKTGEVSYKYVFGSPPFTSDAMQKAMHMEKMRANEMGWRGVVVYDRGRVVIMDWDEGKRIILDDLENYANGKLRVEDIGEGDFKIEPLRYTGFKAISSAGPPLTIGRIGRLCEDFMRHAKVRWKGQEVSLMRIWYEEGVSMGSRNFPWTGMEEKKPGQPTDEIAPGSADSWFLSIVRGLDVRKAVLTISLPQELTVEFFQSSTTRAWNKIGKITHEFKDGVPQNPFLWYLLGILLARTLPPNIKMNPYTTAERLSVTKDFQNKMPFLKEGESKGLPSPFDALRYAKEIGCITEEEGDWVKKNFFQKPG